MEKKPETRLFVDAPLAPGAELALSDGQTHYLRNVLRLKEGARVAIFNGRDGEFAARIESLPRSGARVALEAQARPQHDEGDLWLLFAPLKRARIDYLVEKATELGCAALYPVMTQHTMVERVNLARLRANAIEAAEQCERLTVPLVHAPQKLGALVAGWDETRRLMLCDETGVAPPIADALAGERSGKWAVLIGPEGGFAPAELDGLRKLPFVSAVSLGSRVLRADTAALAAVSILRALLLDRAARS